MDTPVSLGVTIALVLALAPQPRTHPAAISRESWHPAGQTKEHPTPCCLIN